MTSSPPSLLEGDPAAARAARWLALLLQLAGALMALATLAVLMPAEWMARTHHWLGMGRLPEDPVVQYLARSASALYAIHGGLYLVVARDVVHHRMIVRYLAAVGVLFGLVILGIDLAAQMPFYWTLLEGPPVSAFGCVLWTLARRLPRAG